MAVFDTQTPAQEPDLNTYDQLRSQWASFLGDPRTQTAGLQAGLSLMVPHFGGNFASNVASAVGEAGEAVGRQEKMDLAQSEAASKQDLRAAQAETAAARAGTAAAGLNLAAQRLQQQKDMMTLQQRVKYALGYNSYISKLQLDNSKAMQKYNTDKNIFPDAAPPQLHRIPTPEEYIAQQESLSGGLYSGGNVGVTPGAPRVGQTLNEEDQRALDWANLNPNDPRAAQIRQRLGQ